MGEYRMRDNTMGHHYKIGQVVQNRWSDMLGLIVDQYYCEYAQEEMIKILAGNQVFYDYRYENWTWKIISEP